MKKFLSLIAFSVLLLVPVGAQDAFAGVPVPIVIPNHSFENPVLVDGNSISPPLPNWQTLGNVIILNPNVSPPEPVPDGDNIISIVQSLPESINPLVPRDEAFQSVGLIQADKIYTLTVDYIGHPNTDPSKFKISFRNFFNPALATISGPANPIQWNTVSLVWQSPSSGPVIGTSLEIVLTTEDRNFPNPPIQFPVDLVRYDNIRVDVSDVSNNEQVIGGEIIPIEATSLILAGAQSSSWMIPVVLSGIGIGLFVVSRKSE